MLKGIAHESRKKLFQEVGFNLGSWMFVSFPTLQNVSVCGNKVIMTPWQYKPVSFMITSKHLADNYRDYFYSIWGNKK